MSIERSRHETDSSGALLSTARIPGESWSHTFQCQQCHKVKTRTYSKYAPGGQLPTYCNKCRQKRHYARRAAADRAKGIKLRVIFWTDERKAEVLKLWNERKNGTEIGAVFGKKRGAILGLLHRMGALGNRAIRRTQEQKLAAKRAKYKQRPRPPSSLRGHKARAFASVLSKAVPALPSNNYTLVEVHKHDGCRYPYGQGPYTFCGHPKHEGSSYCPAHHKVCHA
jgi:hypothetical protein